MPRTDRSPSECWGCVDHDSGAVAEFVMVIALLTVLTLSVIQLGLALLIRKTVQDAADEGSRFAAIVNLRAPLPEIGLVGIDHGLEVNGYAAVERLDR